MGKRNITNPVVKIPALKVQTPNIGLPKDNSKGEEFSNSVPGDPWKPKSPPDAHEGGKLHNGF